MATVDKILQVQLVGNKIRQLRKEHKLTQVELSSRLGIQQSDLSRMEQGEYRVSLDTLFRILAEFKMSIGEFFEGVAQESITPRDVKLVQEFNSLPRDAQREVEHFIAFKRVHAGADHPGRDDARETPHRSNGPTGSNASHGEDAGLRVQQAQYAPHAPHAQPAPHAPNPATGACRSPAGLRQPMPGDR
jgi:transcriptional regulator with XRE-family HTH domain